MALRALILCLIPLAVQAGVLGPDYLPFVPTAHPDGSVSWVYTFELKHLKYLSKEDQALPVEQRNQKLIGAAIAHAGACPKGWEIVRSRTEEKRLIIEGRCL